MITRFHKILIGLLVVQIALVVVTMTRGQDTAALKEQPIVAGFDAAKVTRVQVYASDTPKPGVDLTKKGNDWVLASGFEFPVDASKVTDVLAPIAKLAAPAPVATQSSRHKQLRVADHDFERKLVITVDGKDVTLFIGTAVGTRRTAVRLAGSDHVYGGAGLSTYAMGGEPKNWINTRYVDVPRDDVAKVTIEHAGAAPVVFARVTPPAAAGSGSGSAAPPAPAVWTASVGGQPVTPAAGEKLLTDTIDSIVNKVVSIELATPGDPKRDATKPTATVTIERKATGAAPIVVDLVLDGDSYWVHDRSLPRAGMVPKDLLDQAVGVDRAKLVAKAAPPAPPSAPGMAKPPEMPLPPPPPPT